MGARQAYQRRPARRARTTARGTRPRRMDRHRVGRGVERIAHEGTSALRSAGMGNEEQRPRLWLDRGELYVRFVDGSTERRPFADPDAATLHELAERYSRACRLEREQDFSL